MSNSDDIGWSGCFLFTGFCALLYLPVLFFPDNGGARGLAVLGALFAVGFICTHKIRRNEKGEISVIRADSDNTDDDKSIRYCKCDHCRCKAKGTVKELRAQGWIDFYHKVDITPFKSFCCRACVEAAMKAGKLDGFEEIVL